MKKVNQKRIHNAEFYLYKILESIVHCDKKQSRGYLGIVQKEKREIKGHEQSFLVHGNVYLDRGYTYT